MLAMAVNPGKKTLTRGKTAPIELLHARSKSTIHTARQKISHDHVKRIEASFHGPKSIFGSGKKTNRSILDHSIDFLNSSKNVSGQGGKTVDTTIHEIRVLNLSAKRKEEYEKTPFHMRRKSATTASSYALQKFQEAVDKAEQNKGTLQEQVVLLRAYMNKRKCDLRNIRHENEFLSEKSALLDDVTDRAGKVNDKLAAEIYNTQQELYQLEGEIAALSADTEKIRNEIAREKFAVRGMRQIVECSRKDLNEAIDTKNELKRINDDQVNRNQRLRKERDLLQAKFNSAQDSFNKSINKLKTVTNEFDIKAMLNASTPIKSFRGTPSK